MNYRQASAVGQFGERRVGDILRSEAPALGYRVLENVLLDTGEITAQIDHLVIDRHGVLVVETQNYYATIRGKSDDKYWTARYKDPSLKQERFLNPLRENDKHRQVLHHVLGAYGVNLPPEYVQSVIVFAGGDLDSLGVSGVDAMRVIPDRELADFLSARYDFAPNPGAMDAAQINDLISTLQSADRSADLETSQRHAEAVRASTRRFPWIPRRGSTPHIPSNPIAARHIYNATNRYPDGSQIRPVKTSQPMSWRQVLVVFLLLGIGSWLVLGGGIAALSGAFANASVYTQALQEQLTSGFGTTQPAPPAPTTTNVAYDVPLALQRLGDVDPTIRAALMNPDNPRLSARAGLPTYTWDYAQKTASGSMQARSISITLNGTGQIVGVSGE